MKFKHGDIVHLLFWDHCEHDGMPDGLLEVELTGRVVDVGKLHVGIGTWIATDMQQSHNNESFSILKSAIIKARKLK